MVGIEKTLLQSNFLGQFVVRISKPHTSVTVLGTYVHLFVWTNHLHVHYILTQRIHTHCTFHKVWMSVCNGLSSVRDESKNCCVGVNDWEGRRLKLNVFASRMATYFHELKSVSQV